jgi:hypothetical protein
MIDRLRTRFGIGWVCVVADRGMSSDAAIRGHVFCSFLALVLRKEFDERGQDGRQSSCAQQQLAPSGPLVKAAHVALPANIREPA